MSALLLLHLVLLVGLAAPAGAASVRALVEDGNRLYGAGQYDEALKQYTRATVDAPESPQVAFNMGNIYYRKGDFKKAGELYKKAALKSRDLRLEARARYNLGNCAFRDGGRQRDSDLKKALAAYEESIRHYREALKLDPQLKDASHNIAVARLTIKDILDQMKKNAEKKKKQQEKQQKMAERLKQLIQEQKRLVEQNEKLSEHAKDRPQDALGKDIRQLGQDQAGNKDKTERLSKDLGQTPAGQPQPSKQHPPTPDPRAQSAKRHLDASALDQGVAAEELGRERLDEARPNQKKALEELEKAARALADQQGQKQGRQKQQQQPQPQPQKQRAAAKDEKAGDILKEEKENRKRRRVRGRTAYEGVDKDW